MLHPTYTGQSDRSLKYRLEEHDSINIQYIQHDELIPSALSVILKHSQDVSIKFYLFIIIISKFFSIYRVDYY